MRAAARAGYDVVITTGGTGIAPRDNTPEMTTRVLDREVPGIAEAMRAAARVDVPTSMLSRGVAGVAGRTLIVNLPGSPGAVRDGMAVLAPILRHAVDQLAGGDHERALSDRSALMRRLGVDVRREPGWPVVLQHGSMTLRPLRMRDAADWRMTRLMNREWLATVGSDDARRRRRRSRPRLRRRRARACVVMRGSA